MKKFWKLIWTVFFFLANVWRFVQFLVTIIIAIRVFLHSKRCWRIVRLICKRKTPQMEMKRPSRQKVGPLGVYLIDVWGNWRLVWLWGDDAYVITSLMLLSMWNLRMEEGLSVTRRICNSILLWNSLLKRRLLVKYPFPLDKTMQRLKFKCVSNDQK